MARFGAAPACVWDEASVVTAVFVSCHQCGMSSRVQTHGELWRCVPATGVRLTSCSDGGGKAAVGLSESGTSEVERKPSLQSKRVHALAGTLTTV